jgi:tryptophan 2,3-dioxygenase
MNGMDRIIDEYIDLMDFALGKNDNPRARNYLRKGMNINSEHHGVADAERRLNAAVEDQENRARENKLREQEAIQRQQEQEKKDRQQIIQKDEPLISSQDKQKLEQLKQRLRSNPKDKRARKELKN